MKYCLGLDFGSLSGRALLVEVETGREVATAVRSYPHGFIEETLPATGEKLPPDWTLQDPQDYLDVLFAVCREVLSVSGVDPADIVGAGIDFTACTALPVNKDGVPLCFLPEFRGNKHAYVKKWKHHAAQNQASRINALAREQGEAWLDLYGGKISSEWLFPKLLQVLEEAPEVYAAMDRFVEAADWLVWQLTGKETCCNCTAGYKAIWTKGKGYPSQAFFRALNPAFENVVEEKLTQNIQFLGEKAGEVTPAMAEATGLRAGTAVATGNVDAHVAVPAVGITESGSFLMIIGTSTCDMVLGDAPKIVPGMCGVVEDGILPGMFGFEAGQSCVGDHFDWFVKNCVPPAYHEEAARRGVSLHQILREKARLQAPGESGLLALDWWNGNRSVLVDVDLTGMILGMTLLTKPEDIYRALIEATAYGARVILDTFEANGIAIRQVYACGGIAAKDDFMMQVYADVLGREITVSLSPQTCALGSAMYGAVAAGQARGGYDSIFDAAGVMPRLRDEPYRPDAACHGTYTRLYEEFVRLHDYFGRGENDVMKRLKQIKKEAVRA